MIRNSFDRRFNLMRTAVLSVIVAVALGIVTVFGFGIYFAIQAVDIIQTDGLKSLVETVWEGQK
ncbi:putative periplasmic protein [Klebsiella phage ValerieMcCarty03]|nr:putative periplasmic protein [Klebsiella phage ValerieMcCarty03]